MGERKVLNKYYHPEFDPLLLPKKKGCKNKQQKVMMMLPMSVRCNTCGAYIWKGKKFNSRKETVEGEDYLGIKIFRFYMRCDHCSAEFTIKTDPEHADYVCEAGAHRNFDAKRAAREEEERLEAERREEDKDAMKALENRTEESKREMDVMEALDELRELNARTAKPDAGDAVFERMAKEEEMKEADLRAADEAEVAAAMEQRPKPKVKEEEEEHDDDGEEEGFAVKKEEKVKKETGAPSTSDVAKDLLRVFEFPSSSSAIGKAVPVSEAVCVGGHVVAAAAVASSRSVPKVSVIPIAESRKRKRDTKSVIKVPVVEPEAAPTALVCEEYGSDEDD